MKRYMRQNHRSGVPSDLVAFDCETERSTHPFRKRGVVNPMTLCHAVKWRLEKGRITREDWQRFAAPHEFWIWLLSRLDPRRRTWVFAHNLGFDFTAVAGWWALEQGLVRFRNRRRNGPDPADPLHQAPPPSPLLVTGDPPTVIDLESASGRPLVFVDTMNYFPAPLAELGQWVGLPQIDKPSDKAPLEEWDRRCRRDAEIVQRVATDLCNWIKREDLGNLRYTIAGQSMALFRHLGGGAEIVLDDDPAQKRWERRAYTGMIIRAHYLGAVMRPGLAGVSSLAGVPEGYPGMLAGPVYRLDCNGCYPSVMAGHDYPVRSVRIIDGQELAEVEQLLADYECIAHVLIRSSRVPYPRKAPGETLWLLGEYDAVLTGPELRQALAAGHVARVYCVQWFDRGRPFEGFCRRVQEMQADLGQTPHPVARRAAKSLANALHGKFGQKATRWQFRDDIYCPAPWGMFIPWTEPGQPVPEVRAVAKRAQVRCRDGEQADSFPLLAGYVTAYARQLVARAVADAGERAVLYQDCDCIHVTQEGRDRLERAGWIHPTEWGKFKEEARADLVVYFGPKHYRWDGKDVRAGKSAKAEQREDGCWYQDDFLSLDSILNDRPPEGPVSIEKRIGAPAPTLRGVLGADGWLDWPRKSL